MDLQIVNISGHGDASKEYVFIKVVRDCNLKNYAVADTTYTASNRISNELRHFYWFGDFAVKAGEYVSVRTGVGKNETLKNSDGDTVHRFHWSLKSPVWNDTGDCAVLFQINDWKTTKAK